MTHASPGREPIGVAVLGATGSVGQRFVSLVCDHPWFELTAVCASPGRVGQRYGEAVRWVLPSPPPPAAAELSLVAAEPPLAPLVLSALDASVAGEVESAFARAGALVVSNAASHRLEADVPLVVPEINPDHLDLLEAQPFGGGGLVTSPNCSTVGLAMALAPLERAFGVRRVHVVTLQALSGAGLPGVASLEALDNVIPFIAGEERKLATETAKVLGRLEEGRVVDAPLRVSAQCNRVAVIDGHLECVSVELGGEVRQEEILEAWRSFRGVPQEMGLPSAPLRPTRYLTGPADPQPRLHRDAEGGMVCSIGRLQPCPVLGWRFVCLIHNTLRGAAGGALLTAELAVALGRVGR